MAYTLVAIVAEDNVLPCLILPTPRIVVMNGPVKKHALTNVVEMPRVKDKSVRQWLIACIGSCMPGPT